MNYRHVYHAGNFADVFKHCILVLLLESLLNKEKPFCYVDTHAGLGIYDLLAEPAQKTHEYLFGVARLLDYAQKDIPKEISAYVMVLKNLNQSTSPKTLTGSSIHFYPGSPFIARSLLRSNDKMILMELHKEDVLSLKRVFAKDDQVAVHHYDGYQGLKAFLPPPQRRGLVLIDPSFEQKDEFVTILAAIETAKSRWETGMYAVWYPIKDFTARDNFLRSLRKMDIQYIVSEMTIGKQTALKEFVGCGMVIINPPWQIKIALERVSSWLWNVLSPTREGGIRII